MMDEIQKALNKEAKSNISEIEKFKKQRLTIWKIRWYIALLLYIIFWHIEWVRWTLIISIPVGLYSLYVILFGFNKILKRYEVLQEKIHDEFAEHDDDL